MLDSYSTFDWQCTDEDSRVNTDVLKQQVSVGNEPIEAASDFVNYIWLWVLIEFGILFLVCCCACLNDCLTHNRVIRRTRDNCKDNCEESCYELADFMKGYLILN